MYPKMKVVIDFSNREHLAAIHDRQLSHAIEFMSKHTLNCPIRLQYHYSIDIDRLINEYRKLTGT